MPDMRRERRGGKAGGNTYELQLNGVSVYARELQEALDRPEATAVQPVPASDRRGD